MITFLPKLKLTLLFGKKNSLIWKASSELVSKEIDINYNDIFFQQSDLWVLVFKNIRLYRIIPFIFPLLRSCIFILNLLFENICCI